MQLDRKSIPRARGDRPHMTAVQNAKYVFQSTHPRGVRAESGPQCEQDTRAETLFTLGCDQHGDIPLRRHARRFNPRTLARGATASDPPLPAVFCVFNPRTPRGVRRRVHGELGVEYHVSIHAPRAGCDRSPRRSPASASRFNPRTPRGVRRQPISVCSEPLKVSDTPRAGCDDGEEDDGDDD